MKTDIAGHLLSIGDTVAISAPGRCSIVLGKVLKLTPKGVIVEYTVNTSCGGRADQVFRPNEFVCKTVKGTP